MSRLAYALRGRDEALSLQSLALGLDVVSLAVAPYAPAAKGPLTVDLPVLPPIYAVPVVAGFVGADAVAASISSGMWNRDTAGGVTALSTPQIETFAAGMARLLIDVGTNTEVVLEHGGRVHIASAHAGPAFEGGEVSQGKQAVPGAIDSVRFDGDDLAVTTIGGSPPQGICGSGLVDAAAALLEAGVLDHGGRLHARGSLAQRVLLGDDGEAAGVEIAPDVTLTQKDVRAFQLAKGAVRAAAECLLKHARASPGTIGEVVLAGALGTLLNRGSALATGLIPPVDLDKIRLAGNAALAGAKMILLSREARDSAETIARSAIRMELEVQFLMPMPKGSRQP